jgi:hypothetical protein
MCGVVAVVFAAAAGCAYHQPFRPAERATGLSPRGYAAADYEIRDATGALGEVQVWSEGASSEDEGIVVHVGFWLENNSSAPLRLDVDKLSVYVDSERDVVRGAEADVQGVTAVAPHSEQQVSLFFPLSGDWSPRDVTAFRVSWTLRAGEETYSQTTPFLQGESRRDYYYSPYYDPYYHHYPWVFHGGVVIHHHHPFHHRVYPRHHRQYHYRHHPPPGPRRVAPVRWRGR